MGPGTARWYEHQLHLIVSSRVRAKVCRLQTSGRGYQASFVRNTAVAGREHLMHI